MEFGKYNIDKRLVDTLKKHGYVTMTGVQSEILPRALKGESLIVKAKTGSGKTHSYLIPILNKLEKTEELQALILAPTRELARQIYDFARVLNDDYKGVDILFLAGGLQTSRHKERLASKPALIIATPGRLKALLINEDITSFKSIHTVVLDEGDMLLDSGFYDVISETLAALDNPTVQLFSATIPQKLANLVTLKTGVKTVIDIDRDDKTSDNVTHHLIDVHHMNRFEVVESFIKHFNPYLLLVFCSTNKEVLELYEFLSAKGHKIGLLTGELESRKRKAMFRRVRNNEFQVVVASDIAARGIDIEHVSDVLSVSFPFDLEFYFHRAGRTGRLENKGNAYTLYDHDDLETVEKVEKLGVKFTRLVYKGGAFSAVTKRISRKKALTPEEKELNVKIKTAVAETKTKKVRPGYKKKVRTAVENVKRKHRRKMIKKSIREQRVERYKAEKRRDS